MAKADPNPPREDSPILTPTSQVTYSSWADEVEVADLLAAQAKADMDVSASKAEKNSLDQSAPEPVAEEMLDYTAPPTHMDINMVYYLPAEFRAADEEGEVAQIDFGPRDAIFEKPKEPVKHLKPLYIRGHINGKPVSRMMVDGGAVVNLMPYSVFRRLDLEESDLMKTNMVLNGFEGKEGIVAKGMISLELTVASKTLATAFFVADVQGNYNVLLGRDWLHAN